MQHTSVTSSCSPTILVVDDDPTSLILLEHILRGEASIAVATSGEAALELVHELRPTLVLLDAVMPGLDGFDTCRALKNDPRTAEMPVIFVTAQCGSDEETRALEYGAVDFISKPFNPSVVRARVRNHLALQLRTDALHRLSTTDSLTGIANRRAFDNTLEQEWRRAMRHNYTLSLLMVDVDHFKRYNDVHGHPAGDDCLRQVARLLCARTQRAGEMVARYGGEEFAIILPHTGAVEAKSLAQCLCASFSAQCLPHGDSPVAAHVSVSIGVGTVGRPCERQGWNFVPCPACHAYEPCLNGSQALIALADQALYLAKRNGRAQVAHLCCIAGSGSCVAA
jgi:diguanylate cyclase (GGDEF)-like protein